MFVSPALAAELGAAEGDVLLIRLQKPSEIPLESLFAHKEDIGRTVRLTLGRGPAARGSASSRCGRSRPRSARCSRRSPHSARSRCRRQVNTVLVADDASPEAVEQAFTQR